MPLPPFKCELLGLALLVFSGFVAWPEEKVNQPKGDHWAFKPAVRPPVPAVKNRDWPRGPIDNFVLARLEAENLAPSQPADRLTLIRRLSFDLIACPRPRRRSGNSFPTPLRTLTRASWTDFLRRHVMANAGRGTGWMWFITANPTVTTRTSH